MWQIAGITAIEMGGGPTIDFVGGRQDCTTSPSTSDVNVFPAPTMTRTEMMGWFLSDPSGFEMSEQEVRFHMHFCILTSQHYYCVDYACSVFLCFDWAITE